MSLADRYDGFIIDLDGVVYLLNDPVPGSVEAINRLAAGGREYVFVTNNSAPTPDQYVAKLAGLGIDTDEDHILNSSLALRRYLERNHDYKGGTAFVVGEEGLLSVIRSMGIRILEGEGAERADFVFVGWDRGFDYRMLKAAALAIRNGATYIATNTDATYPTATGLWPGTGSLVAAVSTASGAVPTVVGKPEPLLVELALRKMQTPRERTLVVGDRLDSDIEAGAAAGVDTLLVLSGVSTVEDIASGGPRPTHVRKDLAALFEAFP